MHGSASDALVHTCYVGPVGRVRLGQGRRVTVADCDARVLRGGEIKDDR
jgi:hypothetical protein